MRIPFSWAWYNFNKHLGSFPSKRNMITVDIFDSIAGEGLDIGHDGTYEFNSDSITRLNIYAGKNIDVVCDGETYPFENETFDKIMLRCILEHVKKPLNILKECNRILKPNGKIVIEVPFVNPIHAAPDDYLRFTPNGLIELVKSINLDVEDIFYVQDYNWAIRWIMWHKLKNTSKRGFNYFFKMFLLKYLINPLLFKLKTPSENDFSSFGIVITKK
tara:strand:- start:260 stop:910 length:651 start_codon:yes stop_codon:yes gene_type:complete